LPVASDFRVPVLPVFQIATRRSLRSSLAANSEVALSKNSSSAGVVLV
jgi:hypothetical protein